LENQQFLQQARNFYQIRTYYTAARPIENMSPPILPVPAAAPPTASSSESGWPQDQIDFYNE